MGDADAGALDADGLVADLHAVEAFDGHVGGGGVEVFAEGNALEDAFSKGRERRGGEKQRKHTRDSSVLRSLTSTKALSSPKALRSSVTWSSVRKVGMLVTLILLGVSATVEETTPSMASGSSSAADGTM